MTTPAPAKQSVQKRKAEQANGRARTSGLHRSRRGSSSGASSCRSSLPRARGASGASPLPLRGASSSSRSLPRARSASGSAASPTLCAGRSRGAWGRGGSPPRPLSTGPRLSAAPSGRPPPARLALPSLGGMERPVTWPRARPPARPLPSSPADALGRQCRRPPARLAPRQEEEQQRREPDWGGAAAPVARGTPTRAQPGTGRAAGTAIGAAPLPGGDARAPGGSWGPRSALGPPRARPPLPAPHRLATEPALEVWASAPRRPAAPPPLRARAARTTMPGGG